ncbi:hypothetical protein F3Y22_tig00112343pilonHSYRG00145 [Hibiscus syriacus]|uniref:FAD/NAD(P)-binding domain-containing protein n=1 Tax=Hibiscus syriacus TaxID=106335 RepID=A0A6A2X1J0_HIBSY|nr:hypothetical protein F3Y22_tig00112343pilonHSYRG00145 [Hibiscus syriacus]
MESGGETRRVVIDGGGISGSLLAKSLQFDAAVTLIDPSVINHRDYLTNRLIVTSVAMGITDTEVLAADGRPTDFPNKTVTLVHKGPRLVEFVGTKVSDKALRWLKSRKVEVKLEQAVDLSSTTSVYKTTTGETIKADWQLLCAAKPLASSWIKGTILKTNLDGHGRLKVDENLRVKGRSNVFAIKDVTDIPVSRMPERFIIERVEFGYLSTFLEMNAGTETGFIAQKHAKVVAKNLKVLMSRGKESKMGKYDGGSATALVSLGRRDAVAQFLLQPPSVAAFLDYSNPKTCSSARRGRTWAYNLEPFRHA